MFALALSAAPPLGAAEIQARLFKQPDAPALKAWFAQHGAAPFALWSRDPWAPILQNPTEETVPAPNTSITLRALGGETAYACAVVTSGVETPLDLQLPSSVALKSKRAGAAVSAQVLAVGYLKSRLFGEVAAPMFSAPQLQAIRAEHALPQDKQKLSSVASVPQQVLNWDTIKDFPILHLRPYQSVALWLSLGTRGAPAGRYRGEMQATSLASEPGVRPRRVQRLNFELTIEPIALPESTSPNVLTWSSLPAAEDASYEPYLHDLHAHGVRSLWGWHPRALSMGFRRIIVGSGDFWATGTGGRWIDPNRDEERQKIEAGGYDEDIARAVANLTERARKDNIPYNRWAVEIWDEPNDFIAPVYLSVARKVRRLNPQIRFMANPGAFTGGWHPVTLKTFQTLDPIVSDWWPYEHHLTVEDSTHLRFVQQTGKAAGFYSTPGNSKDENASRGIYRRMAWTALHFGLDGFGFWAYNTYYGDAWNDSDAGGVNEPDAAVVYPGVLGPIPTRNWEAFGRGVQDFQMVRLLERALARANTPARSEQARATQTELKRRIADAALNDKSPARFEEHRAWLRAQILKMPR